jgi:hypothetical protein
MKQGVMQRWLLLWLCVALPGNAIAVEDPIDIGARAQIAYLKGDAADIGRLVASTAAWDKSAVPVELYTRAFVQFRQLQFALAAKDDDLAERSGESCVQALTVATRKDPRFAEGFALQSVCYGYMANLGGFGAIKNGSRSGNSIESALMLDLKNPRVILVEGFGLYFRPKFVGGDKVKGCERFKEAAAAFDTGAGRTTATGIPWGHAEAHYWLGRCAVEAGDAAASRRSFERALAIAPEFSAARKRLAN